MWLMMAPFYVALAGGIVAFGFVGMLRQFSGILGTVVGAPLVEQGDMLKRHLLTETASVLLALGLVVLLQSPSEHYLKIIPFWVLVRFFFSNLGFVFFYKFLIQSKYSGLGNSAIVQLFVTQGATILAPLIGATLPFYFDNSFLAALWIDIITSTLYLLYGFYLHQKLPVLQHEILSIEQTWREKVLKSFTEFWRPHLAPWNWIQFLCLIILSGLTVQNLKIAMKQPFWQAEIFYPLISFIYGVSLWIVGELLKRVNNKRKTLMWGLFLTILSSGLLLFSSDLYQVISIFIFQFAFWLILHSTNFLLLESSVHQHAGVVRASMVFYLAILFGSGEYLWGFVLDFDVDFWPLAIVRGSLSLIILSWLIRHEGKRHA